MGQKLVSQATYWRRRVVVLAAAVAVLGLPIWAVNQALGGSRAPGQGSPRSTAGHVTGANSRAGHGQRQAPTRETADLGSQPQPSAGPGGGGAPSPGPGRQTCTGRAVRLTLRSAQRRYGPGELVTFVVGAVSTRSRPCRF